MSSEKYYKQAAEYMQRIFKRQAIGGIKKGVNVKWSGKGFVVGYGSTPYGIYVDYGTYADKVNPLNPPKGAKYSPKGFGSDNKGIQPRFFTILNRKEREKVYDFLTQAENAKLEEEFNKIKMPDSKPITL